MLNPRQKKFVDMYLSTRGDIVKAIQLAFPEIKRVDIHSRKLQKNDTISALLAFIDGEEKPTVKSMVDLLWKTIRNSNNDYVRLKGAELIAELEGYKKEDSEEQKRLRTIQDMERIDNGYKTN